MNFRNCNQIVLMYLGLHVQIISQSRCCLTPFARCMCVEPAFVCI